jgi:mono/diheme cytochrome c family protein
MRWLACTSVLFVLAVGCNEAPKPAAPPPAPPAAPPAAPPPAAAAPAGDASPELAEGKRLFLVACANCHGPDGTGQMMRQMMPKIGDLTSAELHGRMSDADIIALATNGRDKMPAFKDTFKPEQIQLIVGYVRTLKK